MTVGNGLDAKASRMDILDLNEVAELLGEPETVIRAACERFPDHIPTVGSGRLRRFPSSALDVLRLVTDSITAGAPDETTRRLIDTHFPPDVMAPPISKPTGSASLLDAPSPEPNLARDVGEIAPHDEDAIHLSTVVRDEVAATMSPIVQKFSDDLATILKCMGSIHDDVRRTARADDLALLRVETRGIVAGTPDLLVTVRAAIASLNSDLAALRQASDQIQAEIASLRSQLDLRDRIAGFATELTNLRIEVQRLAHVGSRPIEHPRPIAFAVADGTGGGPRSSVEIARSNGHHPPEQLETDHPLDTHEDPIDPARELIDSSDDQPTGIITQFGGRTPRRMGRSLFADDV